VNVKDLLGRWLKEVQIEGKSDKCKSLPNWKNPDTGNVLTYEQFKIMTTE
jgi:hypothetical protein